MLTLNKGIVFKDTNVYSPFSKYNLKVINFFVNFFTKESLNLEEDLAKFFNGLMTYVSHPQLILCAFKTFTQIETPTKFFKAGFFENFSEFLEDQFKETYFSQRYLGYKFVATLFQRNLDIESCSEKDLLVLMKIISNMPKEFFSLECVTPDKEAIHTVSDLLEVISRDRFESFIESFLLTSLMETKATLVTG